MFLINKFKNALSIFVVITITFVKALEADEVQKIFKAHEVVPDVIPTSPKHFLNVTYENGLTADKGVALTLAQVKSAPKVDWEADDNAYYTLIMTDPDAPNRRSPILSEYQRWIVANIPGKAVDEGDVIASYLGSSPPEDTGLHRYVFLVYKQPSKLVFDEPHVKKRGRKDRTHFSAQKFANKYNLGAPIAGNFLLSECPICENSALAIQQLRDKDAVFDLQYIIFAIMFLTVIKF